MKPQVIGIIGGGISGTLLAIHLLRRHENLHIHLFNSPFKLAKGVAYSTPFNEHILNVPVSRMSLFDKEPGHLLQWLQQKGYPYQGSDFMPRPVFGDYASDCWQNELQKSNVPTCDTHAVQVHRITRSKQGFEIENERAETLYCDKVVLAWGNFPPAPIPLPDMNYTSHAAYKNNPWDEQVLNKLDTHDPVFIIGTGLSMVDMLASLDKRGHRGPVRVISTHGYKPCSHLSSGTYELPATELREAGSILDLFKIIRKHMRLAASAGKDWRPVIDAVRPYTQELWQKLTIADKQSFMEHLRHLWGMARHRIPAESNALLNKLEQSGQLILRAARLQKIEAQGEDLVLNYRLRHLEKEEQFRARLVINCTGPASSYKHIRHPLLQHMLREKLIYPDALHLGLHANKQGQLLDESDHIIPGLFSLGPPLKGLLWESTAVPEIRVQAEELSAFLLQ